MTQDPLTAVELEALVRLARDPAVKRAFSKLGAELPELSLPPRARIGRPPVSNDDGPSMTIRARVGSDRAKKFHALGGPAWLREQIDRAQLPMSPAPAAAQNQESPVVWRDQLFD